jgi:hypothetical protein
MCLIFLFSQQQKKESLPLLILAGPSKQTRGAIALSITTLNIMTLGIMDGIQYKRQSVK